ncbi:unnamed protein product, partial [Allacma fusca]
ALVKFARCFSYPGFSRSLKDGLEIALLSKMDADMRFRRVGDNVLEFKIKEEIVINAVRVCQPPLRIRYQCQSCDFSCLYPSAMYRHFLCHKRNQAMIHPKDFQPVKILGAGHFGEVLQVKKGNERMALKIANAGTTRKVARDVLKHADSNFVAIANYHCKSATLEYYGMDIFAGSLEKLRELCLREARFAIHFAIQAANCVEYLHSKGYTHNDIKLENFLFNSNYEVRISDMDSVMDLKGKEFVRRENIAFDLYHGAPELIKKNWISRYSDLWALGATIFELFCPQTLILTGNRRGIGRTCLVLSNNPHYIQGRIGSVQNPDFQILLRSLLRHNPRERRILTAILGELSPWAQSIASSAHMDLVRDLPQQPETPEENIQRVALNRQAEGSLGDNFYFDRNVHQNLVAERDQRGRWVKKPRIA